MKNRTRIAKISALISILAQSITYFFNFVSRKIILISLGIDYLGLNSTLSQVLGALSVTELGIQTVIIYKLYKPVVEGNKAIICELMSIIRFFYRIVALIIFFGAVVVLPILDWILIDISIPKEQIYFAWIIMAVSSALSYLMNYNCTIIYADQKQYIYQGINLVLNLGIVTINLLILYFLKNYYIYLVVNMIGILSGNLILVVLRKKMYPWVCFVKTKWSSVVEVAKDTFDIFFGRIAGYVFNSTDSIIISVFISTSLVGYLGNYNTITLAVMFFIANICGPIQAIVGNMLVSENRKFLNDFIKKYTYILYFIGSCIIIPTALLLDDFVELFYGKEYLLDHSILYLLILYVVFANLQTATGTILDADGQFKNERNFYIVASGLNIVLSILGAITIGVEGVLFASVICMLYLLFCRVFYCYKLVVENIGSVLVHYFYYILKFVFIFVGVLCLLRYIFDIWLPFVSINMFIIKGTISVLFVIVVHFALFRRTSEFKYMLNLLGISKITG